jgi:hypothetical protein
MLRRPVKHEKLYNSYTDIDVESGGDRDPSSPYGSCSSSTIAFKLTGLMKKQWNSFTDTNFAICQESTDFVVEHKPTFDKEKLKLIQMSTFIENDITCGTVTAIKTRSKYDGPLLNDQTFSPDWNNDARKINELIEVLNRQIARENLLRSGSSLSIASFASCLGGADPSSSSGGGGGDSGGLSPMPIEVSHKTVAAFASNPRLFLQSPLHVALLGVLLFAVVGLLATISMLLAAFSLGAFLFVALSLGLLQLYRHREEAHRRLEEARRSAGFQEARGAVVRLGEQVKAAFQSTSAGAGAGAGAEASAAN